MTKRRTPTTTALALVLLVALVAPACGVSNLNFVEDDRVSIVAPADRAKVAVPLTIEWKVEDFDGTFAVFVDRAPVPPGRTLAWLAREDDACKAAPGCPGVDWFNAREVYPTSETRLTLVDVPELDDDQGRVFHEATIVLIDEQGKRVGESAFTVQFEVEHA